MKILTRYLFREIFQNFFLFTAMAVVVQLVNIIYSNRDSFVANSPPVAAIVKFVIYAIPQQMSLTIPMIGLLATVFAFGILAKNREILAIVAAGVSFRALAKPAFLFGVGLALFCFWFNEEVVPASESRANFLEKVIIKGKGTTVFTAREDLFVKGEGNRFYCMEKYLAPERVMLYPTILELYDDSVGVARRIEAQRAALVSDDPQTGQVWNLTGTEVWNFNRDGSLKDYQRYKGTFQYPTHEALDKFLTSPKKATAMSFPELWAYRELLRRQGSDQATECSIELHQKLASPITCLIMVLLGFSAVVDMHARRFARGFVVALLLAIGYYLIMAFFTRLGRREILSPVLTAWGPVFVFSALVYWLYLQLHRIRS